MQAKLSDTSPIVITFSDMPSKSKHFKKLLLRNIAHSEDHIAYVIDGSTIDRALAYLYPNSPESDSVRNAIVAATVMTGIDWSARIEARKRLRQQKKQNNK